MGPLGKAPPMAWRALLVALGVIVGLTAVESRTWADSPQLTSIWEATKNGNVDHLIEMYSTDKDAMQHRSADGRGPLFWAYEFKQIDILALLMSENVDLAMEDEGGKKPSAFYDGSAEDFETQARDEMSDMGAKLKARIDEKAKAAEDDDDDDEEEEEEDTEKASSDAEP